VELGKRKVRASLMAAVLLGGTLFAGCNDNVEILRDPDVRVAKGMTWAWRPTPPPGAAAKGPRDTDGRPVVSRDVITTAPPPEQHLESNRDWNTEANRDQLKSAIERALKSKGLVQVTNPETADFLVDYHVAVKTQKATVGSVYPGYPGLVCGPYGCWSGWGWGPPEVEYRTVRWHEGTFVLDIALRSPHKLAYRAISQKELKNKPTITPYQAEEAVNHLLKGFKVK
jgi:Domain of unknown function (DUF4136)